MRKIFLMAFQIIILLSLSIKNVSASVILNCDDMKIGIEDSIRLQAFVTSGAGSVTWSTDPSGIVEMDNGTITGLALGSAFITASSSGSSASCKVTVVENYISVTSVYLAETSGTVNVGKTKKITGSVNPGNASNKKLFYISGDDSIASVDESGTITGKKAGNTVITVYAEDKSATYNVTVTSDIALEGISLPATFTVDEKQTKSISITYKPENATNKRLTWKSSDTKIATVDNAGRITGVSSGIATITATSEDGKHTATTKVSVNALDKTLKGISLNKTELTLDIGKSETLSVIFNPINAENKKVVWKVADSKILSVTDGEVTAIRAGTTEVTVTSVEGGFKAVCKVKVPSPPIKAIKFEKEEQTVSVGTRTTLMTVSTPEEAIIEDAVWTSSDPKVATVKDGVLSALTVGTTEVTVSDKEGKIKATTKITVEEAQYDDLVITVQGYDLKFDPNKAEYTLKIDNETSLDISVNRDFGIISIVGNDNLKNGSKITITINDDEETTYVINIVKRNNNIIYFACIIGLLVLVNIIRIVKNRKKK